LLHEICSAAKAPCLLQTNKQTNKQTTEHYIFPHPEEMHPFKKTLKFCQRKARYKPHKRQITLLKTAGNEDKNNE
jgi:hypothetical protein